MEGNETPALEKLLEGLLCPRCGYENTYTAREVDLTARVGGNTITVTVTVSVCGVCGEQLLDTAATDKVSDAVTKLQEGDVSQLMPMGEAYRLP